LAESRLKLGKTKIMRTQYLIVGNSAGGIGAAEAIRQVDTAGSIIIISDEPYPAYSRPLISEYLAEGRPLEKMLFRPADFYEKNDIHTLMGRKVERLNIDEHTIELESEEGIIWGKLLLATGGVPVVPPIKGIEVREVFTFTTLDDAKAIDQSLNQASRAVVIGGGLIGTSVTEALVKRGTKVTVVEMKERLLNTILDEGASALEEEVLRQAGVSIMTSHTVAEINSNSANAVNSVTLDDGSPIPCELVIVAIGVTPRTELVDGTGIKVKRGIIVDHHMATSSPDVYACGDVAEAYDFVYGENRLTPIWPNAYIGGRIAGFNMAGIPTEYPGGTDMNSLKYFGLDIVSAGIVAPPDDSYEVLSKRYDNIYRRVVLKDGLVVGMVFLGNIEKSGIVFGLMKDKVNVDGFKQELLAYDFGLASLPEEIWRPKLEMPPSGLVSTVPLEQPEDMVMGE
jgi:NAD(P)H-nitrite reductase large subunit